MKEYRKCFECRRPMRRGNAKAVDHPGTISYGGFGLCAGCYKDPRNRVKSQRHLERQERLNARHDPTRLEDLISFSAVTTPGRYPAECVYGDCRWRDYAHSDLAIRAKAYVHAEVHLEPLESE